jgi:hypothetical protein
MQYVVYCVCCSERPSDFPLLPLRTLSERPSDFPLLPLRTLSERLSAYP